tara:strand:+ start:4995 stop:8228 length:3234 start_codon:yes stop_codon:yes gene_type:complete
VIHKNLTPFYWGPKLTSRKPPKPEVAVCVRGVFKLVPGQPLVAIEDPIEQGFMSGELFAVEDIDQTGALTYPGDFADWKPFAEVLVKGTAYPPQGEDVACTVGVGVGDWEKTLRVTGPRTYVPGAIFGGSLSEPRPFKQMPLTWANAYGGPGYPENPVGRGFEGPEMGTIEYPTEPLTKPGVNKIAPAGFGPISPNWPQRVNKRGKKYGKKWRATRYPFFSEDFDWTYFNTAPEDQRLEKDPQGDEVIRFHNLHPEHPTWTAKLPSLRIRALVKTDEDLVHDLKMRLDTLYADLDQGRLYLTWRGHAPVREIDLADVAVVLIASEPLESEPLSTAHYEKLLAEFEEDPIGLEGAFPPGFLEVAQAIEAAELADLNGTPKPDLTALAKNLPAGCPFPPWFLTAAAGDPDPLGIKAKFPASFFDDDPMKPILLEKGVPEQLADEAQRDAFMAQLQPPPADDPKAGLEGLAVVAELLPPDQQAGFLEALESAKAAAKDAPLPEPPTPPVPAAEQMAALKAQAAAGAPEGTAIPEIPSLDEFVAKILAPLDEVQLPEVPDPALIDAEMAAKAAELTEQEAALRARGVDNPLLGLFALGHRLIAKLPRPADCMPDVNPILEGLGKAKGALALQGVGALALAPLTALIARVTALRDAVPLPAKPEKRDYAYANLKGHDFSGQSLVGKSFACADLKRANFSGADLTNADLSEAVLTGADLTGATLKGAKLGRANLVKAKLQGADLGGANLAGADLTSADLSRVNATGADALGATFAKAVLQGASLVQISLIDADLSEADFSQSDLTQAKLESAKGPKVNLAGARLVEADLRFCDFSKADLSGADLSRADLSMAMLDKVRADEANFSGAKLDMAKLTKSRLQNTNFKDARGEMTFFSGSVFTRAVLSGAKFTKCDFAEADVAQADFSESTLRGVIFRDVSGQGARFVKADLGGTSVTGKSSFRDANFAGLEGRRSVWQDADLRDADFSYANLRDSYFTSANCEGASFFAAQLKGSSFMRARLVRTRFVSADLCSADLTKTAIVDSQFTLSNCYDVKFLGAEIGSCDFLEANLTAAQFDPDYQERR